MRILWKSIVVLLAIAAAAATGAAVALYTADDTIAEFGGEIVCDAFKDAGALGYLNAAKRHTLVEALTTRADVDEYTKIIVKPIMAQCPGEKL